MTQTDLIVLGIETSCDETAAAVVGRDAHGIGTIYSNIVHSQLKEHRPYGGVVPEIAARAHVSGLDLIIQRSLDEANLDIEDIDAVAATAGPGLVGGVLVGLMTAKAISAARTIPLLAINHLEGHALTARLTDGVQFPFLLLLVSGGHTQILVVRAVGEYEQWGTTIDDALGEAFDKTAKLLSLEYPGGPAVESAAADGIQHRFAFPRPIIRDPGLNFSFSGLKTAVRQAAEKLQPISAGDVCDLCASFQASVCDVLANRAERALDRFMLEFPHEQARLVVAGGVAANQAIGQSLAQVADAAGAELIIPPPSLCTDNGVMIAWAGAERLALGLTDPLTVSARARWPLGEIAGLG